MTGFYFGRQSLYFPSYTHTSESHAKTWSPVPSHQEDCIDASIIFWMVCHLGIFAWKVQWKNIIMKKRRKKWGPQTDYDCCSEKHKKCPMVQAGLLTLLTFAQHRFSPLAASMEGGDSEFYSSNFKYIFGGLESECVWQQTITCCSHYRMPQNAFFHELMIFLSAKRWRRHFFSTLHPLSLIIFATATVLAFVLLCNSRFNFHCYTQHEATPLQKAAWKWRCCLSQLLVWKITKGIQLCKPASLNCLIRMHAYTYACTYTNPWVKK